MSNIFDNNIAVYNRLQQIYEDSVYKNLRNPSDEIESIIAKLLNEKDTEFSLKKENSVYSIKFYSLKTRVKESKSFYEKLIRKELGTKLMNLLDIKDLNDKELSEKKGNIVTQIYLLDDIIGIRIVTELKNDCENVYKLLLNSKDYFSSNQIKFSDLEGQPQSMRNGLDIYRIKGIYQHMYGFELQIKSKIDEAWGDLDHTLFYKDYSISPIKDTVQVTMNNVGELLDRIENLLFDLRNSGGDYSEKADHLQKQMLLESELGPLLKAKLGGVVYSLKEISSYLNYFKSELKVNSSLTNINLDYLNLEINNDLIKSYVYIRNNSIALLILESIYVSWYELCNGPVTSEHIDSVLLKYLHTFISFIFIETGFEDEGVFNEYFESLIMHSCSPSIFLRIQDHISAKIFSDKIDATGFDLALENKDDLKNLLNVHFFKGNTSRFLEELQEQDIDISDVLLEVKDAVRNSTLPADKLIHKIIADLLDQLTEQKS